MGRDAPGLRFAINSNTAGKQNVRNGQYEEAGIKGDGVSISRGTLLASFAGTIPRVLKLTAFEYPPLYIDRRDIALLLRALGKLVKGRLNRLRRITFTSQGRVWG